MKPTCPHCGEKNIDEIAAACHACGGRLRGSRKSARRARDYDGYAVGRRVLRVAPAWLLLTVVAFVLALLFFGWVSRRGGASEDEAFRHGVTTQSPPPPEGAHTAADVTAASDGAGSYSVQVGAFAELSQANEQVSRLRAAGFEARVAEAGGATRFRFRVRSGLYATREEAARLAAHLRARGVAGETVIVEPGGR